MEERNVTIPLEEYNSMRDKIAHLEKANEELAEIVEKVKDMDETRVIIKEITTFTDDDGDELDPVTIDVTQFEFA